MRTSNKFLRFPFLPVSQDRTAPGSGRGWWSRTSTTNDASSFVVVRSRSRRCRCSLARDAFSLSLSFPQSLVGTSLATPVPSSDDSSGYGARAFCVWRQRIQHQNIQTDKPQFDYEVSRKQVWGVFEQMRNWRGRGLLFFTQGSRAGQAGRQAGKQGELLVENTSTVQSVGLGVLRVLR